MQTTRQPFTHSFNHPFAVARARTYVHRVLHTEHRFQNPKQYHAEHYFVEPSNENYAGERANARESERRRENNGQTNKKKLEHTVARIDAHIFNDVKQHPNHYVSPLFSTLYRFRVNALRPNEREWTKKIGSNSNKGKLRSWTHNWKQRT